MHNSLMFMCLMFTVAVIFQCFIYNILLVVCVQRSSCNCFLLTINKVVLIQTQTSDQNQNYDRKHFKQTVTQISCSTWCLDIYIRSRNVFVCFNLDIDWWSGSDQLTVIRPQCTCSSPLVQQVEPRLQAAADWSNTETLRRLRRLISCHQSDQRKLSEFI